jgi:asparagine synthase (glutamine-hydrolysing)
MGVSRLRTAPRRLIRSVYRALPAAARRPYVAQRLRRRAPWLRPAAVEALVPTLLAMRPETAALDERLDHYRRQRPIALTLHGLDLMAADRDARFVNPLLDLGFLASLARFLGRRGVGGRTAVMRALFSDVLPEAVLTRETKATFAEAFCGPHTRRIIATWDGSGLDPDLIDPEALRRYWDGGVEMRPLGLTALLIQAAWLATYGGRDPALAGSLPSSYPTPDVGDR